MPTLVQFGAGNIGRSFIGQLFSRGGYEVVFVDVSEPLIEALNQAGRYRVVIKESGVEDETFWVENVRAVDGKDREAVVKELVAADLAGTSVGKEVLPRILETIAEGFVAREAKGNNSPLDILFAENVRHAAALAARELKRHLPPRFPTEERTGLVETSIGKMVPTMKRDDLDQDPLWVFAEAYNTLVVDAHGFRGGVPDVEGVLAVDTIQAYVDRKLFLHNLGHAGIAYLGHQLYPKKRFIAELMEMPDVVSQVRTAMEEAVVALHHAYPQDLPMLPLRREMDDLIRRFGNQALGDTVFRVGRDLSRKLGRDDRLVGAMHLAASHGLPFAAIGRIWVSSLAFHATDEQQRPDPADVEFHERYASSGRAWILREVSGLQAGDPVDKKVCDVISAL